MSDNLPQKGSNQKMIYRYAWKNNAKRKEMYGRLCVILATGKMGSCLIKFVDGQTEVTSRRALRREV